MSSSDAASRLTVLVSTYRRMVRAVIARVGGAALAETRDDVEQQVWLIIWRRLQGEQEIDHPTSYLYTVARHEALRAVQEGIARAEREREAPLPPPAADPHRQAALAQETRRLREAIEQLSPDRRRAMQAVLNGLDVREIQDLFGWPYEKARNLIARGRADLKAMLVEDQ